MKDLLFQRFRDCFGSDPDVEARAPGRVNIIGEHIDYNGGYVMPIAIGKKIRVAASITGDDTITLQSANLRGEISFDITFIQPGGDWGDYPKGVVAQLIQQRYPVSGFNAFFLGDLPIGAGVSSSAAMEVAVCYLLQKLFGFSIPPEESALLCQKAEHEFSGTQCGIMDQFVSIAGVRGHAILLNCDTLEHEQIPFSLGEYVLVACNSRVGRELAASEYNKRRAECNQGLRTLIERFGNIRTLCDATMEQVEECASDMPEPVFRRCRHAISENTRVMVAVKAMESGDLVQLGRLMDESHDSLRNDYAVSCPELDLLVDTARSIEGVLGSRLTGAGFGGSTISLVHQSNIDLFQGAVSEAYLKAFDNVPQFFECIPSDGAALTGES
ncbi:MAG: galactokinase [Planctomycetota bacterium]|jgi:galactokinase